MYLFCSHQIFILLFTFFIYASYHLSRKPISVVKVCIGHILLKMVASGYPSLCNSGIYFILWWLLMVHWPGTHLEDCCMLNILRAQTDFLRSNFWHCRSENLEHSTAITHQSMTCRCLNQICIFQTFEVASVEPQLSWGRIFGWSARNLYKSTSTRNLRSWWQSCIGFWYHNLCRILPFIRIELFYGCCIAPVSAVFLCVQCT